VIDQRLGDTSKHGVAVGGCFPARPADNDHMKCPLPNETLKRQQGMMEIILELLQIASGPSISVRISLALR
jgi:hypothetical protein